MKINPHWIFRPMIAVGLAIMIFSNYKIHQLAKHANDLAPRSHESEVPPSYRLSTDGQNWRWEYNFLDFPNKWYPGLLTFKSRKEAADSAWYQYEFEHKTNVFTPVK